MPNCLSIDINATIIQGNKSYVGPYCGRKTANINRKKWQSHLNSVVIGHYRYKTAKITKGREGKIGKVERMNKVLKETLWP